MKRVTGVIKGTAATLSVGIGFKPESVRVVNLSNRDELALPKVGLIGLLYGLIITAADGIRTAAASLATGLGIFAGAAKQAVASTVALVEDLADYKGDINAFTLDTPASLTGSFNVGVDTATVGVGSVVVMSSGESAMIVALTNDGDADDEVTLDKAVSGAVVKIYGKYSFSGCPADKAVPAGFTLGATAAVNVDGNSLYFEAIG